MRTPTGLIAAIVGACSVAIALTGTAQDNEDVGQTGFDVKRPVVASACSHGCPWGELGDFLKEALAPLGYDVVLCRNCNKDLGPRLVANASLPPELTPTDTFVGTTTRVNAPVDFGITESGFLAWAYAGRYSYAADGAMQNLRLIAKIEDPTYVLAAVKADSPITDLSQIAEQKLPLKILGGGSPTSQPILDYYGLTASDVQSWGGSFTNPIVAAAVGGSALEFDLILNELASPANNPESAVWNIVSQQNNLRFLDISDEVLQRMADDKSLGMVRATAQWGLLRGLDRPIPTIARSGHAIFSRDDAPEAATYAIAKAIHQHRAALKWYIRPYSYDPQTVWQNQDVPLHPGAERYYREQGFIGDAARCLSPADQQTSTQASATSAAGTGVTSRMSDANGCTLLEFGQRPSHRCIPACLLMQIVFVVRIHRRLRRKPSTVSS